MAEHCPFCAHEIPYRTREALAEPWRGMWNALCAWEAESNPGGIPTPLRAAIYRITDERPAAREAVAVNTTRLGRENLSD